MRRPFATAASVAVWLGPYQTDTNLGSRKRSLSRPERLLWGEGTDLVEEEVLSRAVEEQMDDPGANGELKIEGNCDEGFVTFIRTRL